MVNAATTIFDPIETRLKLVSNLVLEVGISSFTQNTISEDNLKEMTITSSTDPSPILGALQYQTMTEDMTANIGDYMQLLLKDTSGEVFPVYS